MTRPARRLPPELADRLRLGAGRRLGEALRRQYQQRFPERAGAVRKTISKDGLQRGAVGVVSLWIYAKVRLIWPEYAGWEMYGTIATGVGILLSLLKHQVVMRFPQLERLAKLYEALGL